MSAFLPLMSAFMAGVMATTVIVDIRDRDVGFGTYFRAVVGLWNISWAIGAVS